jgi:hypothetical protein
VKVEPSHGGVKVKDERCLSTNDNLCLAKPKQNPPKEAVGASGSRYKRGRKAGRKAAEEAIQPEQRIRDERLMVGRQAGKEASGK